MTQSTDFLRYSSFRIQVFVLTRAAIGSIYLMKALQIRIVRESTNETDRLGDGRTYRSREDLSH